MSELEENADDRWRACEALLVRLQQMYRVAVEASYEAALERHSRHPPIRGDDLAVLLGALGLAARPCVAVRCTSRTENETFQCEACGGHTGVHWYATLYGVVTWETGDPSGVLHTRAGLAPKTEAAAPVPAPVAAGPVSPTAASRGPERVLWPHDDVEYGKWYQWNPCRPQEKYVRHDLYDRLVERIETLTSFIRSLGKEPPL